MTLKEEFYDKFVAEYYEHNNKDVVKTQDIQADPDKVWSWVENELKKARKQEMWKELNADAEIYEQAIDVAITICDNELKELNKYNKTNYVADIVSSQVKLIKSQLKMEKHKGSLSRNTKQENK
jgi:hypothetical protein